MRILHVSDCYLPRLGGIEVQVHALAQRQRAAGHDVEVMTATPPRRHDRTAFEVVDGVPVHRVTQDLPFELPVHTRVARETARLLARSAPFDAVHVHTGVVSPFAYGALPTLLRERLPVVVTVHSMWGPSQHVFRAAEPLLRWGHRAMVLSSVSEAAAAPIRRAAGSGVDVRVIPNGIDPDDWRVDPLPRDPDDVVIAAVMRLAPRKRCLPMLRMLREVRERVPGDVRMRLVVIGEGPERPAMQRFTDRHAMDWVELAGRWDRPRIREFYRRADLFVSTSNLESFGIAALEARTAGLPVVAKACTGATEFVQDGTDGVLARTDAEIVEGLLTLVRDPARRAAVADHNRAVPPPVTWADVLDACNRAYREARAKGDSRENRKLR